MFLFYDASAKSSSELPSLNDSIHPGPSLMPAIMDILIRFRAYKYGITADILWFRDPIVDFDQLELIVLRFTNIVFGISVSPFLLNARLRHHISEYSKEDTER